MFFFQAEDGIRDLVRSRGLGDVYKRQPDQPAWAAIATLVARYQVDNGGRDHCPCLEDFGPVSYTHLTLPTSDLV